MSSSRRIAAQENRDCLVQAILDLLRGKCAAQCQCGETLERGGERHGEAVDRALTDLAAALAALDHSNDPSALRRFAVNAASALVSQDSTAGALPTLYAAVQDLPGAGYVGPDGSGERTGAPTLVGRARTASDPEAARRLWSCPRTGVTFSDRLRTATATA